MRFEAQLISFSVLKDKMISIKLKVTTDSVVEELYKLKNQSRKILINNFFVVGVIKSIGIGNDTSILLHAPLNVFVVNRLTDILRDSSSMVTVVIMGQETKEISRLLREAAIVLGKAEDDILFEVSSFRSKDGEIIKGEKLANRLSEKRQKVVIDKLKKIVSSSEKQC